MAELLITAPTTLPVELNDYKAHRRVLTNSEDEILNLYLSAATDWAEQFTRRALITQTWEVRTKEFPHQAAHPEMVLPRGKLQSVTSVKYLDLSDVEQTLASSVYEVDTTSDPGRVLLGYDQDWPDVLDYPDAVRVRYVCGYGDTPATVPIAVRQAIMLAASHFDLVREMFVLGTIATKVPFSAESLLQPYRLLHL